MISLGLHKMKDEMIILQRDIVNWSIKKKQLDQINTRDREREGGDKTMTIFSICESSQV